MSSLFSCQGTKNRFSSIALLLFVTMFVSSSRLLVSAFAPSSIRRVSILASSSSGGSRVISRWMSSAPTDGEKTEEEKAAIKAAREQRK